MISLKLCHGSNIRRVPPSVTNGLGYIQLVETVQSYFSVSKHLLLKYEDDESDLITISSDLDFAEAVHIALNENRKTLRVFVSDPHQIPESQSIVHEHVCCDGCGVKPLQGIRYKCAVCPDFDFCEKCEKSRSHHSEHPFLKIRSPEQTPKAVKVFIKSSEKADTSLPSLDPNELIKTIAEGELSLHDVLTRGSEILRTLVHQDHRADGDEAKHEEGTAEATLEQTWECNDLDRAVAASMELHSPAGSDAGSDSKVDSETDFQIISRDGIVQDETEAAVAASIELEAQRLVAEQEAEAAAEAARVAAEAARVAAAEAEAARVAAAEAEAARVAAAEAEAARVAAAEAEAQAEAKAALLKAVSAKFAPQIRVLETMGFHDIVPLVPLLVKHNGDMLPIIEELYR